MKTALLEMGFPDHHVEAALEQVMSVEEAVAWLTDRRRKFRSAEEGAGNDSTAEGTGAQEEAESAAEAPAEEAMMSLGAPDTEVRSASEVPDTTTCSEEDGGAPEAAGGQGGSSAWWRSAAARYRLLVQEKRSSPDWRSVAVLEASAPIHAFTSKRKELSRSASPRWRQIRRCLEFQAGGA